MSVLLRYVSLRRLRVVLGLASMVLVFAPSASGAAQRDTVTATGSGGFFSDINISAQSGTSGQNPSGTASFKLGGSNNIFGPVTCLSVTGPDHGAGTAGSPTTAVLNFQDQSPNTLGVVTVMLVDNGGNGVDIMSGAAAVFTHRVPTDCSLPFIGLTDTLTNGRAVVFDAPLLPTTKAQCKTGGWLNFPQFKNQGDCVSFVQNGK